VLGVALVILVIVAASEAAVASASRARLKAIGNGAGSRAERLRHFADERASVLGALAIARNLSVVVAAGIGTFLVTESRGHTWGVFAVASLGALLVVALLDALPRLIVARAPEALGMRLVPAITVFTAILGPVAGAIDRTLRTVVQDGGQPPDEAEELLRLVEMEEGEAFEEDERQMIRGVIDLGETTAREIMAPRIDIVALEVDATLDDAMKLIVERGFSRIPLYQETIDNVLGMIYAKDLLRCVTEGRRPALADIARPAYFIPESKRVDELLEELRRSKVHIAIVVDEYGGTAGLVTIEDLLEEIVGEIQDEYDREEAPIERVTETEAILDARVSIDALAELFDFELEEQQDYDTIGGFVYHHLGKVPSAGDEVSVDGLTLRVLSVLGRRIKKVRATRVPATEQHIGAK
jgi:CBS domain containing-hemolysin-like protein